MLKGNWYDTATNSIVDEMIEGIFVELTHYDIKQEPIQLEPALVYK